MKMREALEFAVHHLVEATESDKYGDDVVYLVGCMRTVAEACRAALSAPPRNCDIHTDFNDAITTLANKRNWHDGKWDSERYCILASWLLAQATERKGESDGCNQTKASEALGVPRIKPCICRGLGVCETRRTESASDLIMPRVEYRVRCDVCGRATHWYEDGGKAEAEWNAVAGIRDECNRLE